MIDHHRKIIFIHIPGTAGSSIEHALCGADWWVINPVMKHAPLSVHIKAFRADPADYYIFSVVRHPFDRLRSLYVRFGRAYGLTTNDYGEIEVDGYLQQNAAGGGVYLEQQPTISLQEIGLSAKFLVTNQHIPGGVYCNYLGDGLAEVFRFEDIATCFSRLSGMFRIDSAAFTTKLMSSPPGPRPELSHRSKQILRDVLWRDFEQFGYS